jgi:hypothetical protein
MCFESLHHTDKLHLFIRTYNMFILIQTVPLHMCYIFRPPSGMLLQKSSKGMCNNIEKSPC